VLIFERIREELALGRTVRQAVDNGFGHAMSAIVDSNITTLITALILYQVGTGPVRGFAVTLSIGIVASFFTAVFITRTFFLAYLERRRTADAISI
jgi:preprotein translocase subunit SecD